MSWRHAPAGTRMVAVAAFMVIVLIFLPRGLPRGQEFSLPRLRRR